MKIISLVAVLCFLSIASASSSFSLSGNVSGVNASDFQFRDTTVFIVPIDYPLLDISYTLAGYFSVSINLTTGQDTSSASGDLIVGFVRFQLNKIPIAFIGRINGSAAATKPTSTSIVTYNFDISASAILTSYIAIQERSSTGSVVRTVWLSSLDYSSSAGSDDELNYVTFNGTNNPYNPVLYSNEVIMITFFISEVLGQVTINSVTTPSVSPKSLESIVQISGWNYTSSSNNLVLITGVGTGSASGEHAASVTLSTGSGDGEMYVNYANSADVNGASGSVTVTTTSTTNSSFICDDTTFTGHISNVYGANIAWHIVNVSFPAGANSIVYDPTSGAGMPLSASTSSTSSTGSTGSTSSGVTLFFSMLLFAIVLFI